MSMYRSFLLKNDFWAKKGNEKSPNGEKVFIRHDLNGSIYAIIPPITERRGVKIIANGQEYFFNNFDSLDFFLTKFKQNEDYFQKVLKRKTLSKQLRLLDI
jgi:hypothetical protein